MSVPKFIVNGYGELGVRIDDLNFFIYKGEAFEYTNGPGVVWREEVGS